MVELKRVTWWTEMKKYFPLFNFDHGLTEPAALRIGPFDVEINATHCEALARLPRRARFKFDHDKNFNGEVSRIPPQFGDFAETAVATHRGELGSSILFDPHFGGKEDYDLVVLLSFLTGRRIYFGDDLKADPRRAYGEPVIDRRHTFRQLPPELWQRLANIRDAGLSDALECVVQSPLAPDVVGQGAYAFAAFDATSTYWAARSGKTKYPDSDLRRKALDEVVRLLDKSLLAKAKRLVTTLYREHGVADTVTADIVARIRNVKGPSAFELSRQFLQAHGLFPGNPDDVQLRRLRLLNAARNAIAHSGTIRKEKGVPPLNTLRLTGVAVSIARQVVEIYLATEFLGLDDPVIAQARRSIIEFFETGVFNGQDVFEEGFDDFLERATEQWMSRPGQI